MGKLRECVSAVRNLEHLIASRDVGPKVLEQVVPDVAAEMLPYRESVVAASAFVTGSLGLTEGSLDGFVRHAQATAQAIFSGLKEDEHAPMNARRRLAVERVLRDTLPALSASLSQVELLVEATSSEGVTMSAFELLSSSPEAGSNRPHRRVTVSGSTEDIHIRTPARIGLRCLGMLASAMDPLGEMGLLLEVRPEGNMAVFSVSEAEPAGDATVKLPMYPHTEHSVVIAAAALARFGGTIDADARRLLLPIAE